MFKTVHKPISVSSGKGTSIPPLHNGGNPKRHLSLRLRAGPLKKAGPKVLGTPGTNHPIHRSIASQMRGFGYAVPPHPCIAQVRGDDNIQPLGLDEQVCHLNAL